MFRIPANTGISPTGTGGYHGSDRGEGERVRQVTDADVTGRLVELVIQMMGSGSSPPQPFPLEQQLADLGITSVKMVTLMLSVEAAFDITIPQSEITPENFHSVATIRSLIERIRPAAQGA